MPDDWRRDQASIGTLLNLICIMRPPSLLLTSILSPVVQSFSHLQGQYTSSRTYTTSLLDAIFEGSAGDLQLHQELASGGRRPEREAVGAAGHVRHEQRAGGDHPQPADVAERVLARERWPSSTHCLCWAISAHTPSECL